MGNVEHDVLNLMLVFFVILVIIAIILVFIFRRNLSDCESTESVYCLQYVCPNGKSAQRTDDQGNTIMSGS